MNPQMQKFEHCFSQRVYHCPRLRLFVEECFNRCEHSVADIDRYLEEFDHKNNLRCKRIFSMIVGENMEHYLIVCETHLKTLLVGTEKITCASTSENTQTVFVQYINEAFCLDCVRQYMMFMYFVFNFVQF